MVPESPLAEKVTGKRGKKHAQHPEQGRNIHNYEDG
jgi:hypothetical protein